MKVLVAGGAGFIGSFTTEALVDAGHEVIVLDNLLSGSRENLRSVWDRIDFIEADICRADDYFDKLGDLDAVIHLAFPTPLCNRSPENQFYEIASLGTANLLELALSNNAYLIYGSSISVYGVQQYVPIDEAHPVRPMLIYGANKLHGEHLCHAFGETRGLGYVVLRYSDIYGPRDRRKNAVNKFLTAALDKAPVTIHGDGRQKRSYTYVRDAVRATLMSLRKRPMRQTLIVSTDAALSITELAETIKTTFCPDLEVVLSSGLADPRCYVFDNSKFGQAVGRLRWTPLETGLGETLKYLKTI